MVTGGAGGVHVFMFHAVGLMPYGFWRLVRNGVLLLCSAVVRTESGNGKVTYQAYQACRRRSKKMDDAVPATYILVPSVV